MKTPEEIVNLYREYRTAAGTELSRKLEILTINNGEYVIPLPEVNQVARAAVPNLVATGIDHYGMRIGATLPNQLWPPLRPGIQISETRAQQRRWASQAWWEDSKLDLKLSRWAREYGAYGTATMHMWPDFSTSTPRFCWRNPLTTFCAPTEDPDDPEPDHAILAYRRTYDWLEKRYPSAYLTRPKNPRATDECTLIEYSDADQITLIAVAWQMLDQSPTAQRDILLWTPGWAPNYSANTPGHEFEVLHELPNPTGTCLTVVPGRISLGTNRRGAYDGNVGSYKAQSLIMALELEGVIEGIFPNEWIVGNQANMEPKVIVEADGRTGTYGIIQNGTIQSVQYNPSYLAPQTRDYLERVQRINSGIPPEFGGESATNVRTGRRGDAIFSATVDYQVGEAQKIFARALEACNRRAVAISKAYFGSTTRTFYIGAGKNSNWLSYTPNDLFETDQNSVVYPFAGMSVENLTIIAGQLAGMGIVSQQTIRELHPFVADPESERDKITSETLLRALESAIDQQGATGQIPGIDLARMAQLVKSGQMELPEAYVKVHEEAQARQSPTVNPEVLGSPATQPGISPGAEAASAIPTQVPPGMDALAAQLGALYQGGGRTLQRAVNQQS